MKKLTQINYKEIRVLTTEQLAEVYETDTNNIKNNFNNNKDRFTEGKHYYFLQGEDLKAFKNLVNDIDLVDKRTPHLYLWTERGASRHCKILDTDKAWEQFDYLEETYFKVKDSITYSNKIQNIQQPKQLQITFTEVVQSIAIISKDLNINDASKLLMYDKLYSSYGVSTDFLPKYSSYGVSTDFLPKYENNGSREIRPATELLKRINSNIKTATFNQLLIKNGYLEERTRKSTRVDELRYFKALTEKGLQYGENLISPRNQREVQPCYYTDTFQELYNLVNEKAGVLA